MLIKMAELVLHNFLLVRCFPEYLAAFLMRNKCAGDEKTGLLIFTEFSTVL